MGKDARAAQAASAGAVSQAAACWFSRRPRSNGVWLMIGEVFL